MRDSPDELRVLVVEDEPRLRSLLDREIAAMGHRPTVCDRAEPAVELLDDHEFDVAILDLNLPGMSGMEFFAHLRGRRPDIAVIIMTGFGDLPSAIQALRLEAVDFLNKPCGLDEIERALNKARQQLQAKRAAAVPSPSPAPPATPATPATLAPAEAGDDDDDARRLADVEREHILAALARHDGHKPAAAADLGISLRTLYNKLAQYHEQGHLPEDDEM